MNMSLIKDYSNSHESQLATLLDEVNIDSDCSYTISGESIFVSKQTPYQNYNKDFSNFGDNQCADKQMLKEQLLQHLTQTLYSQYYCGISKEFAHNKLPAKKQRDAFMNEISQFNASTNELDKNWKVYAVDGQGNAFAEKNGNLRQVLPNSYAKNSQQLQDVLTVNQTVDFYRQRENKENQAVFYYVFGNEYMTNDCQMMRVYWNVSAKGAGQLIKEITIKLNEYKVPFQFKCLNHPELYFRNDSAVLYFDKTQLTIVSMLIKPIIKSIKPYLVDKIPLFTDKLATGVALAEDPGQGQSFGMSRAILIAEALLVAYEENLSNKNNRNKRVKKYLIDKGVNLQNMALNPHTTKLILH